MVCANKQRELWWLSKFKRKSHSPGTRYLHSWDAKKLSILSPSIIHLFLRSLSAANITVSKQNEMQSCCAFQYVLRKIERKYSALCEYTGWGNWMVCGFVEGLQMISFFDLSVFLAHKAVLIQVRSHRRCQDVIIANSSLKSHVEEIQFENFKKLFSTLLQCISHKGR